MSLYDDYGSSSNSGLYGSYVAPKVAAPVQASQNTGINFGTIAHSFLSGLAHAAAHPVQTVKDDVINPTVNAYKQLPGQVSNIAKGTVEAGKGALGGSEAYKQSQLKKANEDFSKTFIGKGMNTVAHSGDSGKLDVGQAEKGARQAAGATIDEGLNLAGPEDLLAKGGAKLAEKTGFKALTGEGIKQGVKYGAAAGAGGALQEDQLNPTTAVTDIGGGIVTGGLLGGVTGGTAGALSKAFHGWADLAVKSAHPDAHTEGAKILGLPEGKKTETLALPATSQSNPLKTTPGGGVFGEFSHVSEDTANKLSALNHTISNFHSEGEKVSSKIIDAGNPGKPQDTLQHISQIQTLRNQAAESVDAIAKDRADTLKSQHDEMGGVSKIKSEDGTVAGRVSQNDAFYSKTYKDTGKPPTKAMWLDEAHRQLQKGTDDQAQHYQQAVKIAQAAHDAYNEKITSFKTSDVYAPKTSAAQADAAKATLPDVQAQAGRERLGEIQPHKPVHDKEDISSLIKRLNDAENGRSTVGQVEILNKLIEHPDISTENKQVWIAHRDALLPSNKGAEVPAKPAEPTTTGNPGKTSVAHDVTPEDFKTQVPKKPKEFVPSTGEVGKSSDVTKPGGGLVEKVVRRVTGGKGAGLINPSRAASREGNVGLSRTATNLVSSKRQRTYLAKSASSELRGLMKGVSHDDVIAAIEGATPKNDKVAAAAAFFQAHRDVIGSESKIAGTIKGQKDNYLPHIARGLESRKGGGANGLKKNTRYNIERQSIEHLDKNGEIVKEDKYKTISDFEVALKKIDPKASAERDVPKILEHMLITEGHAVENARTVEKLMDTRMQDGRPVLARTTEANLKDQKFNGYLVLDNKMVHPDAKNLYEAITKTGKIDNPVAKAFIGANVATKRLVTLNGMVHALNIWKSSFAAQGVTRAIWAIGSRGATKDDFVRALGYGAKFARASNDNLFDEVGKATGLLGKFEKATDPLTHALFHGFGDRQGMATYKYIEGKMLKKGLSPDEAGRIAADGANQVMHFVPEDQQSIVVRQSSQIALFAGQFLQNTMKTATNAVGVGLDRTLSKEGQKAAQKLAVTRIARMFAYSFASAQAINLAATGKYTWQNGNGDSLNPVWYQTKDKYGNTKQYRITNHYGQLKDIAGFLLNPAQEAQNKLAPGARELVSQISNTDLFTGNKIADSKMGEGAQLVDRLIHAASNMFTPAGINLASPSKQPGIVQAAKYVGVNSSSAKPNDTTDYAKLATDKTSAQSLLKAYTAGDQSKLAAMQALKASGNGYFDKFFAANPTLDPTNKNFAGFKANDSKQVSAGIKEGFDTAKANGQTLQYMQSIQESGSSYFSKFFAEHPDLDPTSDQFVGSSKNSNTRQKSEAKYLAKGAKYAGANLTRAKGTVKTTVKSAKPKINLKGTPMKFKAPKAPKTVGGNLVRRRKVGL